MKSSLIGITKDGKVFPSATKTICEAGMYIRELVKQHGYNIWVRSSDPDFKPIRIVRRMPKTSPKVFIYKILNQTGRKSYIVDSNGDFARCSKPKPDQQNIKILTEA
jgi:hypothetical protein